MTYRMTIADVPLAERLGVVPLLGDIHNHCDLSYGHGRLEDALARAAIQLDFVSVTGHAHWPDMPVDDPEVAHIVAFHVEGFARLADRWPGHYEALRAADRAGFTVFPGYEIHSAGHGDYTIVYRDLDDAPMHLADSPAELRDLLDRHLPGQAFAFPHHIGYRHGARGISWSTFDPALSPVVEMMSMHGCAEESDTALPYLHSMGPSDGAGTMRHGLAQGHVFGVVGNTDHHSAFPGSYGHGRMVAYARRPGREAIWEAITARRTTALTGANVHLLAAIGDEIQGGIVAPAAEAFLDIEAVAGGPIDSIDVIRNGRLVHRVTPALQPAPAAQPGRTILFLEMGWGPRGRAHRWEGEISVDGARLLGVEPRFRGRVELALPEEEGRDDPVPRIETEGEAVGFDLLARGNPTTTTSATQGVALHLDAEPGGHARLRLCGREIDVSFERLRAGALSGNLGPIDSPAWRLHRMPAAEELRWSGRLPLGTLAEGETVYLRLRQSCGQMAWTSPIFCRAARRSG
ncbi:hypothetical protein [Wenxinia saemankumensis]|uniref:DUF3604 domain-containing protein n=1 Tax=Wenxinia saemankumensis TaxID=1447782 RepID=A0A1M6HUM3_9RHOB|nr:hypothetical protein [Wenxinia saemankumensis]SHJ25929.1 hypothetical protein SAMN05444417_3376 [Wenxinia saemankumensis]